MPFVLVVNFSRSPSRTLQLSLRPAVAELLGMSFRHPDNTQMYGAGTVAPPGANCATDETASLQRRYTSSSADSEEGKAPQKSYSSSETLKAYDQDARLAYGSRIKDMVPQEAEEFCRTGANFSLRELGLGEVTPPHGTLYRTDIGLPHCGYSMGASSDADMEADTVLSPEHPVRLWGRSTRSGRSSCLSSRANSNLTLTDTEHENTETGLAAGSCLSPAPAGSSLQVLSSPGPLPWALPHPSILC
ncbi:Teneurin-4 [Myotis brandtii]|uniref:Teneurin-4 n=1 Tax=Myotis brandtii TaxID=109478 RepID=S7NJU4_MYOBR|nr:Teneurin-4 [Myotis brandtii]